MSKETKPVGGGINSLSKLRNFSDEGISRGDAHSVAPHLLLEEEGFNSRGAFALDYWNRPDVVAHVRGFAESYKNGQFVPPIVVVVRNADVFVRDGAHRRRGLMLAIEEGADIQKVSVVELKGDEAEQAKLVLTANDGRPLSPLERAVQYKKLVAWGWSLARIAKEVNKTAEHVRTTLPLLELPIELKRLIAEETIAATLALKLYNEHGAKALDYVNEALSVKVNEQVQEDSSLELALNDMTAGLDVGQAPTSDSKAGASAEAPATQEPAAAQPRKQIKITGKNIDKLAGSSPKISKKTVEFVHKGFAALGQSIDQISIQGDHFVMKLSADEVELLKEIKAQLAAATKQEVESKDTAQASLLDQPDNQRQEGVTLQ